jgi:uncharacterized membrane protein
MTPLLPVATAVGTALVAGTYAAFTIMVMPALARRPTAEGVAAMHEINRRAERGGFVVVFGATAVAAVALGVEAWRESAPIPLAAAALSLAGTVVTAVVNVPMNRRLDRDGAGYWARYRRGWGIANAVRGVSSAAAVGLLALG